jgi:hypothetical protein
MTATGAVTVRPAPARRIAGRRCTIGLVAAVAVVGLTACSAGSSSSTPTTTAPSGTTAPTTPAVAALAAYRAMWADLVSAARTSDFQSSGLSRHATGSVLTLFVRGLARDQLHGIVTRGQPVLHPTVTSSSADHATVTDCVDDTHWVEYTTSGARAKNAPGGRRATTAELVRRSGVWKVDQLSVGKVGTC